MRKWLRSKARFLLLPFILLVFALIPMLTMGAYWVRDVGLITSDAVVFSNDTPGIEKMMATVMKGIYGARIQICNGDSDETEINAAIAAMPFDYGTTTLNAGTFLVDDAVVLYHGLRLVGAGMLATTIKQQDNVNISTGIIYSDGQWNRGLLQGFTIDGNQDNNVTGCYGIYLRGNWYSTVTQIEVKETQKDGIFITSDSSANYGGECYFELVQVHDCSADGWHIGSWMDSVWVDCYEYNAEEDGFKIVGNANNFIHCHAYNDGWNAFEVSSDAKHTTMIDCGADGPGMHGFKVNGTESRFIGCSASNVSQHGSNYDGFHIDCTYVQIVDGHIIDADAHMEYGIYEDATGDYSLFQGNVISDFGVGAAGVYVSGAHTICRDNIGYLGPGETQTYKVVMTAGVEDTATYFQNPYAQNVWIKEVYFNLTTAASATAPTYDIATDADGSGVPDGTALLDAVPDTVATYWSWSNAYGGGASGVQTGYVQLNSNAGTGDWIGICIEDAAGADSAGIFYVTLMGQ